MAFRKPMGDAILLRTTVAQSVTSGGACGNPMILQSALFASRISAIQPTVTADTAQDNVISHVDVDCNDVTNFNMTLNVTSVTTQTGNVFMLYTQVNGLLQDRPDFFLVDQSVAHSDGLQAALGSAARHSATSVIVIQNYRNIAKDWCCLTGHFGITMQKDNITMEEMIPPAPYYHDAMPLAAWLQWNHRRAQIALQMAHHLHWNQFFVIYEAEFENIVESVIDLASAANVKTRLSNTGNFDTLGENILHYFEETSDFNIVMMTSFEKAQEVLQLAKSLESKLGKRIPLAGLSKWLLFSQRGRVDLSSYMFTPQAHFDNIAVICDPQDLHSRQRSQFQVTDMFAVTTLLYKTQQRRELTSVGSVGSDWTLTLTSDVFPNTKFGFNGRLFIVTTAEWPPYVHIDYENNTVRYSGFCMDLAEELGKTLNFTIEYTEPEDKAWGADTGNGSFNGMVGQLQRQEVDMIMAPIGVTVARERVIDFTFPFFYDDSAVIMKKPDPDESKWRTYIDIFKKEVLICITAALVIASGFIMIVERAEKFVYRKQGKNFAHSLMGSFWYLLGAMLNQGGRNLPTSLAGRMFLSSWWLFCLVVAGTFSGNLIAVLTVTKDKPPFNTLEEMANQDDYKFGTLANSMWSTLFETSPRAEFQKIHNKMVGYSKGNPDIFHSDPNLHLQMVKAGKYAYIADKGLFSSWLATNCDLMLLKEKFFPGKYAIGLPNNSVYTKIFSDQVVKIYESGLLQVWVKKWWPKQSFCGGPLVTEAKTLTLIDVQSTFYLIGIGFAIAGLVLMTEAGIQRFRELRPLIWSTVSSWF